MGNVKKKLETLIKKDGIYLLISFSLLMICLLSSTTIFVTGDYSLYLPLNSLFANIAWGVLIVFGILGIIFLRNVDRKK